MVAVRLPGVPKISAGLYHDCTMKRPGAEMLSLSVV